MDIFEELFGGILSHEEIGEMIALRNLGMLRTSFRGDPKLQRNPKQIAAYQSILSDVYKLAELDSDIKVLPPDITPDTAFRIHAEVPIDMSFTGASKEILMRILPRVSVFGFGIKSEELKTDYEGEVETIEFEFVVPDVYTYPFDEGQGGE